MKKTVFFSTSLLLALFLLNPVSAQQGKAQDVPSGQAIGLEKKIQQQEITQNQGEEQNIRVENTLQGEAGEAVQEGDLIQEQTRASREAVLLKMKSKDLTLNQGTRIVKEKSNDVAQKVQELLLEREYKGGIGEQVRVFAQNQLKAQEEIRNRLTNLEERPVWQRFFLGQNQEDVDNLQNSLRKNQEELTELQNLLADETLSAEDRLAIEEAYLELKAQQELVQTHASNIMGEFNVVGFFRKLFGRS
jgi:hypothetical protein